MKRFQIHKISHHLSWKKLSNGRNLHDHQLIRQFSVGFQLLRPKVSSPLHQSVSKENIRFNGIIKSTYPEIPEIDPDTTIDKYVWENVARWPNHVAVECGITGQKYTFSKLRIRCKKFATSLLKRYQPGQVLSIMLPNSPDYVVAVMGAIEAGMIVSPVNPIYTSYELSHQLYDCGAVAIVTQAELQARINEAKELVKTTHKVDYKLDFILLKQNAASTLPQGVTDFKDMVSDLVDHTQLRRLNRCCDDIAVLPYSSGTTGLSKGVQLTHKNCVSNCMQVNTPDTSHFLPTTNDYQDVAPAILPFFHIYGFSVIQLRALRHGVKMVTLPKFEAAPFLSILKEHRATVLYAVPPIILFLGNHPQLTDEHMASMRIAINGAGPIGAADAERVTSRFKSNLIINQAHGMTETSPVLFIGSQNEHDYTSVGKPIRSTLAKVIKSDGCIALPKEQGEICVKGPQVMLGYLNKPDATKEVIDEEKYFHTGDVGYYDEQGRFYIVDRLKELIKVKGFQVPPAELEALMRTHPKVLDAAVIGIPDEKTGERPLAFIVTRGKKEAVEKELIEYISSKVAPYKRINNFVFVDTIPKSQAGKILRRKLKEKFEASK